MDAPKRPKGPKSDNGPDGSTTPYGSDDERKSNVLAFIRQESAIGGPIESQTRLEELTSVPTSTLSDWLGEWEAAGFIVRTQTGRCKAISVPARAREMA